MLLLPPPRVDEQRPARALPPDDLAAPSVREHLEQTLEAGLDVEHVHTTEEVAQQQVALRAYGCNKTKVLIPDLLFYGCIVGWAFQDLYGTRSVRSQFDFCQHALQQPSGSHFGFCRHQPRRAKVGRRGSMLKAARVRAHTLAHAPVTDYPHRRTAPVARPVAGAAHPSHRT